MTFQCIEINPKICFGKPVFKGTRIPVTLILELLSKGRTTKKVLQEYPTLKPTYLKEVFLFAKSLITNEEVVYA
jgi:uncharacterized protein (DUF433 family)